MIGSERKIGLSKAKGQPPMGGQLQIQMTVTPDSRVPIFDFKTETETWE